MSVANYRQYVDEVSRLFIGLAVVLPIGAAVVALGTRDPGTINLVHVVAGAAWAGATIYLTAVLNPALIDLDAMVRAQVTLPLIPKHILLFSSLLVATLITGAGLAGVTGRSHTSPVMIASYAAGVALLVVGLYLVWLQNQIYTEAYGSEPDMDHVEALSRRLGITGLVGAGLQVITLAIMAILRVT